MFKVTIKSTASLADSPILKIEEDYLGLSPYIEGLEDYIRTSSMPRTIGIHGEWGTGKTSIINALRDDLCESFTAIESKKSNTWNLDKLPPDYREFYAITINIWEFSILHNSDDAVKLIIRSILDQVKLHLQLLGDTDTELLDKLISVFKVVGVPLTKGALHIFGMTNADAILDYFGETERNDGNKDEDEYFMPAFFRDTLQKSIQKCIDAAYLQGDTGKRGFLIFIDDLDRIEPKLAICILDLLKNYFNVNNCIFVLAIDYNILVKGVKLKFEHLNDECDDCYQSYIDKIIQVSFSIPTDSYTIETYITKLLKDIDFFNDNELSIDSIFKVSHNYEVSFKQSIIEISKHTIGNNPRAIKQLLNKLSLTLCIYNAKQKYAEPAHMQESAAKESGISLFNTCLDKFIVFSLTCIQIAYPEIYNLLRKAPDFMHWLDDAAELFNCTDFIKFYKPWYENENEYPWNYYAIERGLYVPIITSFCMKNSGKLERDLDNIIFTLQIIDAMCRRKDKNTEANEFIYLFNISSATDFSTRKTLNYYIRNYEEYWRRKFWFDFDHFAVRHPRYSEKFQNIVHITDGVRISLKYSKNICGGGPIDIIIKDNEQMTENDHITQLSIDIFISSHTFQQMCINDKELPNRLRKYNLISDLSFLSDQNRLLISYERIAINDEFVDNYNNWHSNFNWIIEKTLFIREAFDPVIYKYMNTLND